MQLQNGDTTLGGEITQRLTRALELAVDGASHEDERRDDIIVEIEAALDAASRKTFATPGDASLVEALESLVLALRIAGASVGRQARPNHSTG